MMMKKILLVPALLGVIGFSAVTTDAAGTLTYDQAKTKALSEVNGKIVDMEYSQKNTVSYYEFDIVTATNKYELKYDAVSGTLLSKEQKKLKTTDTTKYNNIVQPAFTLDQIKQKALTEVKDGTVTSVEFEGNSTASYFEADVVTATAKYELIYDAVTGELLSNQSKQVTKKQTQPTTTNTTNANTTIITVDAIKQKALAVVNGTITEVDYERKGTQSYYEVDVRTATAKYELKFNAVTGELVKQEQDDDDHDDYDHD